ESPPQPRGAFDIATGPPPHPASGWGSGGYPPEDAASAGPGFESLAAHRQPKALRNHGGLSTFQQAHPPHPPSRRGAGGHPSASARTFVPGTVKLSPRATGASARGG